MFNINFSNCCFSTYQTFESQHRSRLRPASHPVSQQTRQLSPAESASHRDNQPASQPGRQPASQRASAAPSPAKKASQSGLSDQPPSQPGSLAGSLPASTHSYAQANVTASKNRLTNWKAHQEHAEQIPPCKTPCRATGKHAQHHFHRGVFTMFEQQAVHEAS